MHGGLPDLRQLSHAVALADHGHFGRAADSVALSQPAFSRSIQSLERRFGCRLFERERGRAVPTPYGRAVVERARRLVHDATELQREVALLKDGDTGELRASVAAYPAELSVPAALKRLLAAHPRLAVRVRVREWQDLLADVASDAVDLGLGEISELEGNDGLETELVGSHRVPFICRPGHPLRRKRRGTLADVVSYPFAGGAWPARAARMLPRPPFAAGIVDAATGRFVPAVNVDRPLNIKDLVRATDAIAYLPRTMCEAELISGELAVVPVFLPWARLNYGFIWRRGRMRSPAALAFAGAVREAEAEVVARETALARRFR